MPVENWTEKSSLIAGADSVQQNDFGERLQRRRGDPWLAGNPPAETAEIYTLKIEGSRMGTPLGLPLRVLKSSPL